MTSLREGLLVAGRGSGTVTPGICGISVLKRSDGGWSGIRLRTDFILETQDIFKSKELSISIARKSASQRRVRHRGGRNVSKWATKSVIEMSTGDLGRLVSEASGN
jgi:hypothetical protein